MIRHAQMNTLRLLLAASCLSLLSTAAADPGDAEERPMRFATPDAAVLALIDAAADTEPGALRTILGPDVDELTSGDPVADRRDRDQFVALANESANIEDQTDDAALLVVGPEDWPFPIPLARDADGWYFDTSAGIEEVLDRRVGLNELHAIATARAVVDAQFEYAAADPDGDGVADFAERFWSSEGKRDGLYWPAGDGAPDSPMGPLVADAIAEGYRVGDRDQTPRPYYGYLFKLLSAKGRDGGDGFGLLAWPASYGNSGVMSFQVNQRGIVYEADLGPDTDQAAAAIEAFSLGNGWSPVTD
jgi:hypothetical protein